jgi:putative ABC transport system ATP-binding protein
VLVVTHDPRTVPYADRIIRIEDGEIVGEERNDEAKKAEARKAARSSKKP